MSYIDMPQSSVNVQQHLQEITDVLLHIVNEKNFKIDAVLLDFERNQIKLYIANDNNDDSESEYSDESC